MSKEPAIFKKYALKPNLKGIEGYKFEFQGAKLELAWNKKALLDETIRAVANKHDSVCIYTGYEGTGKTSDAFIDAAYISKECGYKLDLNNIHFLPEDIEKAVTTSPAGTVHIWDEAIFGLDSKETMGKVAKALTKVFTVCRSRRQFVFLVIPNIWMMNKYFATVRSRFLVHHISKDGIQRGDFRVYGRKNKSVLYNYGKKSYSYSGKKGLYDFDFAGNFIDPFNLDIVKNWVIDKDAYEEKKQKALESINSDEDDSPKKSKLEKKNEKRAYVFMKELKDKYKYSYTELGKMVGEARQTITSFYDSAAERQQHIPDHISFSHSEVEN